ncbi:hypothetical protein [Bdellovibrio sp. HCB337]|uniref:hypothetical protein n=1 Tax=Bdellovibrio sp. HCB337 TaxID=3394358 RepID=UPI0039A6410C
MKAMSLTLAGLFLSLNAAYAAEQAPAPVCLQSDQAEFIACLNNQVVADQIPRAQAWFESISVRLVQGYDLSTDVLQKSFTKAYGPQNGLPTIEVGTTSFETEGGEEFTPALVMKKRKASIIENNIRRAINFASWFHARSFGRTSSMLFAFRRLEIQAHSTPNVGLALRDKTLVVTLPQNRMITEKEMIDFWNSGRVLVPAKYAELPMSWIKFLAKFSGPVEQKTLEYWKFLNPVGEFRVALHALYLAKVKEAKILIDREPVTQAQKVSMVSFLENPTETAKSLDSLFSISDASSGGNIVVVNRTTGFCPIKISNSHVINVSVSASRFQRATEKPQGYTVTTDKDGTRVESDGTQSVHIVNDKTIAGIVCVDTHDNVDVSLDVVFGQLDNEISPEKLVNYAKSYAL